MPDDYEVKGKGYIDANGKKHGYVPSIAWFTNINIAKRHEDLDLNRRYDPADYPQYDNYDAIEVSKVAAIPNDYFGQMGVPITFLDKYNPDQFEIIGHSITLANPIKKCIPEGDTYDQGGNAFYLPSGSTHHKRLYGRIVIKRKVNATTGGAPSANN